MGVGMRDTTRHITHRRPPVPVQRALPPGREPSVTLPVHLDALRQLIASGQYQVNARYLAMKIFRAAGVPMP
jgi:hypothetical protein